MTEKDDKEEGWIPCSQRMPKQNECVNNVYKYYLIQDEYEDMHIAHYTNVGWIPIDGGLRKGYRYVIEDKVVAWRPLPEKYKEDES